MKDDDNDRAIWLIHGILVILVAIVGLKYTGLAGLIWAFFTLLSTVAIDLFLKKRVKTITGFNQRSRISGNTTLAFLAIVLGAICFYFYIPYSGLTFSWFFDHGFNNGIRAIMEYFPSGVIRTLAFKVLMLTYDLIIQITFCTILLFWFTRRLKRKIIITLPSLIIGSLSANFFLYLTDKENCDPSPLSHNVFLNDIIAVYLFNMCIWFITFYCAMITSSYFVNLFRISKRVVTISNKQPYHQP